MLGAPSHRGQHHLLARSALLIVAAALALIACGGAETSIDAAIPAEGGSDQQASLDAVINDGRGAVDQTSADTADDAAVADGKGDGLLACAAAYARRTTFVDRSAPSASRVITFRDYDYTPKCIRIKAGQQVIFQGDFVRHPLQQACGPVEVIPFVNAGLKKEYTFVGRPGIYGYYCVDHGSSTGLAMAGAIEVR